MGDDTEVRYGISGSRSRLNARQRALVLAVLAGLAPGVEYTSGGCAGIDAFAGRWLADWRPQARQRVVVPADRHHVDPWWVEPEHAGKVEVVEMSPGTSFRDRNKVVLSHSDMLVAFPAWPEGDARSRRSGTWMTVRIARRQQIPVVVNVLNGKQ